MVKAQKFIYAKEFDGEPKLTDFELQDEELPDINDGGKYAFDFVVYTEYDTILSMQIGLPQRFWPKPST